MLEKILVFSESHGSGYIMEKLLEDPPEGLTAVFFLGDGAEGSEGIMRKYPQYAYLGVKGNCDIYCRCRKETIITIRGGVCFMLTHGHEYGVKSSLDMAAITAAAEGATILLYGHTHIQNDRVIRTSIGEVRAVNPGSARNAEYAIITVNDGEVKIELKRYSESGEGK